MGELRRELGTRSAVLITVGSMIGSGIFVTPHDVALRTGSHAVALGLWGLGGALALLGAMSFAELGAAIPQAGGAYVYLRRAYGPLVAFLFGWAMLVVLVPASVAFFAQTTARNAVLAAGYDPQEHGRAVVVLGVAVVAVLTAINVRTARAGAALQDLVTVVKFAGVLALALVFLAVRADPRAALPGPLHPPRAAWAGLVSVLWAYDGWIEVTSVAGELKHPSRDVPRALALGTVAVTALYLLCNVAYLRVLGPVGLAASSLPALDTASRVFGTAGRAAAAALVGVSTFGGCAIGLFTGARVVYAVAADGLLFAPLARTSRAGAPGVAVAACGALSALYLASRLGQLGELFVVGTWPFYALGALATVVLRRREPDLPRPLRTPGYPVTPVLFALASLALVVGYAVTERFNTAVSLGLVALGAPLYFVARARKGRAAGPAA